ncbi:K+/H+ antiporter subunit F [bacterium]|nr:K+/H+ antiporter subunit F [bacterium]
MISIPLQIIFFGILGISLLMLTYRVLIGPHVLDRVMVLDFLALIVICLVAAWELALGTNDFFDAILILTIIGFVTTVALAKYLESGRVVE